MYILVENQKNQILYFPETRISLANDVVCIESTILKYKEWKYAKDNKMISVEEVTEKTSGVEDISKTELDRDNEVNSWKNDSDEEENNVIKWNVTKSKCKETLEKNNNTLKFDSDMKEAILSLFQMAKGADDAWMDLVEESPAAIFLASIVDFDIWDSGRSDPEEYLKKVQDK